MIKVCSLRVIRSAMIVSVWRRRWKVIRTVLWWAVYHNIVLCNIYTHVSSSYGWFRLTVVSFCVCFCVFLKGSICLSYGRLFCVFFVLFGSCLVVSCMVSLIAWKDPSPKWPHLPSVTLNSRLLFMSYCFNFQASVKALCLDFLTPLNQECPTTGYPYSIVYTSLTWMLISNVNDIGDATVQPEASSNFMIIVQSANTVSVTTSNNQTWSIITIKPMRPTSPTAEHSAERVTTWLLHNQ